MNHRLDSRRIATASLAALATLLIVACGGSDDESPGSATMSIAAAGGTLDGPGGSQLVVPAGALARPTSVTVAQGGGRRAGAAVGRRRHRRDVRADAARHRLRRAGDDPRAVRRRPGSAPARRRRCWKTNAAQTGWDAVAGRDRLGRRRAGADHAASRGSIVRVAAGAADDRRAAGAAVGRSRRPRRPSRSARPARSTSGPLAYQWRRNGVADRRRHRPDLHAPEPTSRRRRQRRALQRRRQQLGRHGRRAAAPR